MHLTLSPPNTECSRFPCFHCYTLGALFHISWMSLECADQNTDEEDEETSDLIYDAINSKQHINENCLMLPSEMCIQEVVKDCASFRGDDGSHLLHLCFDNSTEYDPGVVFDKNEIFSAFCSKCCWWKRMLEARIKLISLFSKFKKLYWLTAALLCFLDTAAVTHDIFSCQCWAAFSSQCASNGFLS